MCSTIYSHLFFTIIVDIRLSYHIFSSVIITYFTQNFELYILINGKKNIIKNHQIHIKNTCYGSVTHWLIYHAYVSQEEEIEFVIFLV